MSNYKTNTKEDSFAFPNYKNLFNFDETEIVSFLYNLELVDKGARPGYLLQLKGYACEDVINYLLYINKNYPNLLVTQINDADDQ